MPQRETDRGRENSAIVLQCLMSPLYRRFRKSSEITVGLIAGSLRLGKASPWEEVWAVPARGWMLGLWGWWMMENKSDKNMFFIFIICKLRPVAEPEWFHLEPEPASETHSWMLQLREVLAVIMEITSNYGIWCSNIMRHMRSRYTDLAIFAFSSFASCNKEKNSDIFFCWRC